MRCFAAIELPEPVIVLARELKRAIVSTDGRWRGEKWVAEENMHVTVAFFGDIEETSVAAVIDSLRLAPVQPFALTSPGFSAIPNARNASMGWLSFADASGDAEALAVWARAAGSGVCATAEEPSRGFKPHVTLVRARMPRRLSAESREAVTDVLARAAGISVSVLSVSVFSSTLTPTGPRYRSGASETVCANRQNVTVVSLTSNTCSCTVEPPRRRRPSPGMERVRHGTREGKDTRRNKGSNREEVRQGLAHETG